MDTLSEAHTHSHTHTLSHTHSHTHTLTHTLSHTHTLTHTYTYTRRKRQLGPAQKKKKKKLDDDRVSLSTPRVLNIFLHKKGQVVAFPRANMRKMN